MPLYQACTGSESDERGLATPYQVHRTGRSWVQRDIELFRSRFGTAASESVTSIKMTGSSTAATQTRRDCP